MKIVALLIFTLVSIINIYAQDKWKLVKNKNEIKVYVSEISGSNYYAFKAVMTVKSTEAEIIEVLRNVSNYPEWFAFTASAKLIQQTTNEQIFFMETDYPWPFSNECMNYNMRFVKEQGKNQKITITETDKKVDCKYSLKKASGYILLEPDKGNTRISYYFHSEPSQNIPSWLINPRIHEMPYQTFISLKEQLNI
ncbi:START domain-containing protein [Aureispira anguillae]|uniref:START domain-containing protein n=1 Tax=Aureispira anguillae TaxID=2864201 RepID=A0A916DT36_9BACT|nr:START domain-containing protein [Aureispira anguillae]BDS11472.1 START domain-containing protein [Aureispira anguillae]